MAGPQPVGRDDPGGAGQPQQPEDPESRRQPVDGDDPGGAGQPQPKLDFLYLDNNQLSGPIPAELGRLTGLRVTRFAGNTDADDNPSLTGCVPHGLRYLMNAPFVTMLDPEATDDEMLTLEAQDFIALGLPFCTLSSLTLSGVTLQQAFASDTVVYTASVTHDVESTTVAATVHNSNDTISIMKGAATYMSGDSVPLDVGQNVITIKVTTTDRTPTHTYTVTILRAEGDQAALMALYNSAGGASWTNKTNWGSTTEPLNTWFGVEADSSGNVTELALSGNNLSGPLPAALGSLTSLTTLDLSDNQLSGTIPEELGNLIELVHLHLYGNALAGPIPYLSKITNLTSLRLGDNQLSGPITGLSGLTHLVYLTLHNNQLTGSITGLSSLTGLEELKLFNNNLSGEIPDLSSITSLRWLSLAGNQFTGEIPASLGSHRVLSHLFLYRNQLTGTIPEELGSLDNLKTLNLGDNQLTGTIPEELGNLSDLDFLYLDNNQLSGPIPAELGSLTGLRVTRFAYNPSLTGCVPNGLRYLMNALDVTMPHPEATGDEMLTLRAQDFLALGLPFCTLSSLTLSGVTLQQAFASDTVVYTASVTHDVESTTVTATLHNSNDSISIMKGAATYMNSDSVPLDVGQNVITIAITPLNGTPTHTYTVTILRAEGDRAALMALYNSAGGASWTDKTNWGSTTEPLNTWFGVEADSNGNVTELALSSNNLSGPLPAALGSLTSLTTLDLSDNQLSGTIPDLSSLTSLTTLNLRDNQLSGTIPDLSTLTQLQTLNLSANQLSGTIPDLSTLTQLQTLNLRDNQLSGTIPDLSTLTQLQTLNLSDNRLSGTIPDLGALSSLTTLNLGENQLSGTIPDWLSASPGCETCLCGTTG